MNRTLTSGPPHRRRGRGLGAIAPVNRDRSDRRVHVWCRRDSPWVVTHRPYTKGIPQKSRPPQDFLVPGRPLARRGWCDTGSTPCLQPSTRAGCGSGWSPYRQVDQLARCRLVTVCHGPAFGNAPTSAVASATLLDPRSRSGSLRADLWRHRTDPDRAPGEAGHGGPLLRRGLLPHPERRADGARPPTGAQELGDLCSAR